MKNVVCQAPSPKILTLALGWSPVICIFNEHRLMGPRQAGEVYTGETGLTVAPEPCRLVLDVSGLPGGPDSAARTPALDARAWAIWTQY